MTEIFLKSEHKSIIIPGYQLYRKDRDHKGGGGVGVLIREHYAVEELKLETGRLEAMLLKVQINKNKSFLLLCVYRPPGITHGILKTDGECFENILVNINFKNRDIIITGDFNLPCSNSYSYFEHILHANLLKQLVELPTRLGNILDLFVTNNTDVIANINVVEPHISDHRMVVATVIVPRISYPTKKIFFRDFKKVNFELLGQDILKVEAPPSTETTTSLVQNFTSRILDIFNAHAPLTTKTITEYPKKLSPSNETLE